MASIPVFRTGSGTGAFGNASSVDLTIPAAVEVGDVMILVAALKLFDGSGVISTPTGWTQLAAPLNGPTGNTFQGAVYMKVAVSGDLGSTLTVSATAPQQFNVAFAAYDLAGSTTRSMTWETGSTVAATALPHSAPGTPPQTGDLVIVAGAARGSTNGGQPTFTGGSGVTVRGQSVNGSGSAQNVAAYVGEASDVAGSRTVNASVASWRVSGQIILQPGTTLYTRGVAEAVTLADTAVRATARARPAGESVSLASVAAVTVFRARPVAEALALADTARKTSPYARAVAEGLSLADLARAPRSQLRAAGNSLTLANAWTSTFSKLAGFAQQITLADVAGRQVTHRRSPAEGVGLAGVGYAGQTYRVDVAESVTLAAVFARVTNRPRRPSEAMSFDDFRSATAAGARYLSEALTLQGSGDALRVFLAYGTADFPLDDAVDVSADRGRVLTEAVTLGHTFVRALNRYRAASNSVTLFNEWILFPFTATGFADAVTLGAEASRSASGTSRAMPEAISLAHTFARATGRATGFADTVTVAEFEWSAWLRNFPVAMAAEITFSMNAPAAAGRARSFGQAITLDSLTAQRALNRQRGQAQAIILGHAFTPAQGLSLAASAALAIADAPAWFGGPRTRILVEVLQIVDAFVNGSPSGEQPLIAYPHRVTMTSRPATVRDTTAAGGTVRRTV